MARRESDFCFADTYFFLALMFEDDEAHAQAEAIAGEIRGGIFTTAAVLTEVADAKAMPGRRDKFLPFLGQLRASPLFTIVPHDGVIFERAVALFDQRPDKAWSLTDCIKFIVMQDLGIADALTAGHHFEQAGFNILFK